MDNFKDTPLTIGEIKGNKTGSAKDWKPRDILISLLRQIDNNEINPDSLAIVWAEPVNGKWGWKYSTNLRVEAAIGLMEMAKIQFMGVNLDNG